MRNTFAEVIASFAMMLVCVIVSPSPSLGDQPFAHHLKPGIENFTMGQFDAALQEFKQAVVETPNDPMVHYYLGSTEAKLDQLDSAVAEFHQAVALARSGSKVRQYAQAALAVYGTHSTNPRYTKLLSGAGPLPVLSVRHGGPGAAPDRKKELFAAEGRAQAIETQAEATARQMQTATIRIGNLTVKRYTDDDIKEVREEAKDKADSIRREARLRAEPSPPDQQSQAPGAH